MRQRYLHFSGCHPSCKRHHLWQARFFIIVTVCTWTVLAHSDGNSAQQTFQDRLNKLDLPGLVNSISVSPTVSPAYTPPERKALSLSRGAQTSARAIKAPIHEQNPRHYRNLTGLMKRHDIERTELDQWFSATESDPKQDTPTE